MTAGPPGDRALDRLNAPAITRVMFHPRPEPPRPAAATAHGHPVRLTAPDGVTLGGWLFPAAEPAAPLVLHFHGNGEIAADYVGLAPVFARLGLHLLALDFRGYGASGGVPTAAALIADAEAAADGLGALAQALGLAAPRLFVMGRSLGSAAALAAAVVAGAAGRTPPLAGLILDSAFADTTALIRRIGGATLAHGLDDVGFDQLGRIARVAVPTLILHGEDDEIIPITDAEALAGHAGAADTRLVPLPGAGHNDLMLVGAERYFGAIRSLVTGDPPPTG